MLPSQRNRKVQNQQLDSQGVPWGKDISNESIIRISTFWEEIVENIDRYAHGANIWLNLAAILKREAGWSVPYSFTYETLRRVNDKDLVLDSIATFLIVIKEHDEKLGDVYCEWVNNVFNEHRIGYKFIDYELVPFEDDYLLQNVVEPTINILISSKFADSKRAYHDALEQIAKGDAGNALTDAGTALQSLLKAVGCEGKELGSLLRSAKSKGVLGPQDSPLISSVENAISWAAAERNQISDAHRVSPANLSDAWMMVHIIGALIVRIADGSLRPTPV